MCSRPSNPIFDEVVQSNIKTVNVRITRCSRSYDDHWTRKRQESHRDQQHGSAFSQDESDIVQNSNLQHIDDNDGKELVERLSDPGSWDEITMNDVEVIVGMLYSSSGYSSSSSNDAISSSLEDARNLDDNISSLLEDAQNLDDAISSSLEDARHLYDTTSLSLKDARNLEDTISSSLKDTQNLDDTISLSQEDAQNLFDTISLSLEDARNLDDADFLPSDPSAKMMGDRDANETARLVTEIEILELMIVYSCGQKKVNTRNSSDVGHPMESDLFDFMNK
ncbi:hypothetical protein JTE90_022886 [Oedothorax gibbosus]|uniref:Uncharacterized protein n=1 Tax=Oedothorax gibbosus TaxID=931172 RepID=A0AAV6UV19_9ARAC|nr:hypothetical protein JTE90_022886 [Oedothorax gibbosus]